jgi:hypothetical protein
LSPTGALDSSFDARCNHEGQSALIVNLHLGMAYAERFQPFFGLPLD